VVTNGGVPTNAKQILRALQADGKLAATIIDRSPFDNQVSVSDLFGTELTIEGNRSGKK
jgi:hypothetical protein